jgi:hypothetical protein
MALADMETVLIRQIDSELKLDHQLGVSDQ